MCLRFTDLSLPKTVLLGTQLSRRSRRQNERSANTMRICHWKWDISAWRATLPLRAPSFDSSPRSGRPRRQALTFGGTSSETHIKYSQLYIQPGILPMPNNSTASLVGILEAESVWKLLSDIHEKLSWRRQLSRPRARSEDRWRLGKSLGLKVTLFDVWPPFWVHSVRPMDMGWPSDVPVQMDIVTTNESQNQLMRRSLCIDSTFCSLKLWPVISGRNSACDPGLMWTEWPVRPAQKPRSTSVVAHGWMNGCRVHCWLRSQLCMGPISIRAMLSVFLLVLNKLCLSSEYW